MYRGGSLGNVQPESKEVTGDTWILSNEQDALFKKAEPRQKIKHSQACTESSTFYELACQSHGQRKFLKYRHSPIADRTQQDDSMMLLSALLVLRMAKCC